MSASDEEARAFGEAFRSFFDWVHAEARSAPAGEVVALLRNHLGPAGCARSVVTKELPSYEQVNLQAALDHWTALPGRTAQVHGLSLPPNWAGLTLQQLLTGDGLPPVRLSAPELADLPSGPGRTLACLRTAVLLLADHRGRYLLMIRGPERHQAPALAVEIAGLEVAQAQQVQAELGRAAVAAQRLSRPGRRRRAGSGGWPGAALRRPSGDPTRRRDSDRRRSAPDRAPHDRRGDPSRRAA